MIELNQILTRSNSVKNKHYNRYCCYTLLWCVFIMRFGKKIIYNQTVIKSKYAWLPITINGETRWLELVRIKGYYWKGVSGTIYFEEIDFVD